MTEAVSRGAAGGLRALARRRPLTVFVAIVLGLGWATMTPMVLAARGLISLGGLPQTRLERRHNFFLAAALTALPFAGVHIPLLLMGSDRSILTFLAGLGSLVGLAVVARTLWGVVLRGAANSTLAIGLMHGVFN